MHSAFCLRIYLTQESTIKQLMHVYALITAENHVLLFCYRIYIFLFEIKNSNLN